MDDRNDVLFDERERPVFKVAEFEGPLDLLLALIQKAEVNIYDIPIAEITAQFLAYIEEHKDGGLRNLADFYRMGADLLYIKSRMLLPVKVEVDGDEYQDPRQELVERLIEYQKFKKYTDLLTGAAVGDNFHIPRKENFFTLPFEDADLFKGVDLEALAATFQRLLERKNPAKLFNVYEEVSIDEKKALVMELLDNGMEITLSDVIVDFTNPLHIICAFMAILVMAKDRIIVFQQPEPYGEIVIVRRPPDWDEKLADEYDRQYDEVVENNLEDPDDFSIVSDERRDEMARALAGEDIGVDDEKEEEFVGDEEDLLDEEQ